MSGLVRETVGSDLGIYSMGALLKFVCLFTISITTKYSIKACPGLVDSFMTRASLPAVFNELFEPQNMCTFVLEICDRDRWIPRNLEEDVTAILNSKTPEA